MTSLPDLQLVQLYRSLAEGTAERGQVLGVVFRRHIRLVGQNFNASYPAWWLDTQAFIHLDRSMRTWNPAKGKGLASYWVQRLTHLLPDDWYNETHSIRMPSHPKGGVTKKEMRSWGWENWEDQAENGELSNDTGLI